MGARSNALVVLGLSLALVASALFPGAAAAQGPPHFTSTPPTEASVGEPYSYDANATDPDNDPLTYYMLLPKPDNMTIDSITGYVNWIPSKVGPQMVIIWVTDGNYQVDQCITVNVTPPKNSPPNITSQPPTQAYLGQLFTYTIKTFDPDGDRVYHFLDQKPPGMTIGEQSGTINWTPGVEFADQSVSVLVKVIDAADHAATQYFAIKVTKPLPSGNRAPVVTGTAVTNATDDSLYFYAITAVDSDGDSLNFCITLGPPGMAIDPNTGVMTWTPTGADIRVWEVRVVISDGKTPTPHNFSINVRSHNLMHYSEDPAKPGTSPEVICVILPTMAILMTISLILVRWKRR
jgi:hypothetical protein